MTLKQIEFQISSESEALAQIIAAFELQGIAYTLKTDGISVAVTVTGA